jgi:hypothetical protein
LIELLIATCKAVWKEDFIKSQVQEGREHIGSANNTSRYWGPFSGIEDYQLKERVNILR